MTREYVRQNPICSLCDSRAHAKGLCRKHYMQARRFGAPDDDRWTKYRSGEIQHGNRKYPKGSPCPIGECGRPVAAKGMCSTHYGRLKYDGDLREDTPIRKSKGWYLDSNGYKVLGWGPNKKLEHRAVMEQVIGRPLHPFENVHHINGIRDDNRPTNLELWTKPQPNGQRVSDLIAWVAENYSNDLRAAMAQEERP